MLLLHMAKQRQIEPVYRGIGQRIRKELERRDISAEKLAFEIDLGKSQLYLFLNGKRRVTIHTLERIAKGLEVSLRDLMP